MSEPEDEGFLGRWSRRKRKFEAASTETADSLAESEPIPAGSEPEVDEDFIASLPKLQEITAQTDVRPFLRRGVPEKLRNAALRRLWTLHPGISSHEDPARDYFWDYNAPGGVPGGGGVLRPEKVAEMARKLLSGSSAQVESPVAAPHVVEDTIAAIPDLGTDAIGTIPIAAPESVDLVGCATESEPAREFEQSEIVQKKPVWPLPRRRHGGATPL